MYFCPSFLPSSFLSCFMLMSLILWFFLAFYMSVLSCLSCISAFLRICRWFVFLSFVTVFVYSFLNRWIPIFLSVFSNALYIFLPLFSVCRSFVVPCPVVLFLHLFMFFSVHVRLSFLFRYFFLSVFVVVFVCLFLSFCGSVFVLLVSAFSFVCVLSSCSSGIAFRLVFLSNLSFCLFVLLSFCIVLCFRIFFFLYRSLLIHLFLSVSFLRSFFLSFCIVLSFLLYFPFFVSFFLSFFLSLFLSLSLSLSFSLFLSFFLSFLLSFFLSLPFLFLSSCRSVFFPFYLSHLRPLYLPSFLSSPSKTKKYGVITPEPFLHVHPSYGPPTILNADDARLRNTRSQPKLSCNAGYELKSYMKGTFPQHSKCLQHEVLGVHSPVT